MNLTPLPCPECGGADYNQFGECYRCLERERQWEYADRYSEPHCDNCALEERLGGTRPGVCSSTAGEPS